MVFIMQTGCLMRLNSNIEQLESQIEHFRGHEKLNILWQKYSEGKTINELSDCMNISESAVKMRLQRAKKTLRQKVILNMKAK